jgi:hypothetical protein
MSGLGVRIDQSSSRRIGLVIAARRVRFTPRRSLHPPLHQEHAFAGRLRVEQFVGLVGLVERPAVGEQRLDIDAAIGDGRIPPGRSTRRSTTRRS